MKMVQPGISALQKKLGALTNCLVCASIAQIARIINQQHQNTMTPQLTLLLQILGVLRRRRFSRGIIL